MATSPRQERVRSFTEQEQIHSLLQLHEATQKINSVLDLDLLLQRIVEETVTLLCCAEASIWLLDAAAQEMVLMGVQGCSLHKRGIRLKCAVEGMIGQVAATSKTRYSPDVRLDPHYIACEPHVLSELDVPLMYGSELVGVLSLSSPELDGFTPLQRVLLERLANHVAIAVKNASSLTRERSDAHDAREIQRGLLPRNPLRVGSILIEGHCVSAGSVGGDWYDYFTLADGRIAVVLADVSGKGMAAALLMAATRGVLRAYADTITDPVSTMHRLNRFLMNDLPAEKFVTMLFGIIDPAKRTFTFANAGHPFPLMIDHSARFLDGGSGLPLGLAESHYVEQCVELAAGSKVVLYSDGIIESSDKSGEEWGSQSLIWSASSPSVTARSIVEDVKKFAHSLPAFDDATAVIIRGE